MMPARLTQAISAPQKKERIVLVTLCASRERGAGHDIFGCHISCWGSSWKIWGSTRFHHSFRKNIIFCPSHCWGSRGLPCAHCWNLRGCGFWWQGAVCQQDHSLCCWLHIRGCLRSKSCFCKMFRGNRSICRGGGCHWRGCIEKTEPRAKPGQSIHNQPWGKPVQKWIKIIWLLKYWKWRWEKAIQKAILISWKHDQSKFTDL